jgi:tRNA(Arg) A34 adenosine deaminase TadA
MSKRHGKLVRLAAEVAKTSDYSTHRHGAVLIRRASIINISANDAGYCQFGDRFMTDMSRGAHARRHAELSVVLGIPRAMTEGATVYVVRVDREGGLRMSKPCPMCEAAMSFVGIKYVYYSTNNGEIRKMKL